MENRVITKSDLKRSAKLKSIYDARKKELGLTQITIAERLGVSQSALSQQLCGKVAMTTENILDWSKVLEVSATDIDPDLASYTIAFSKISFKNQKIAVMETMSGKKASSPFIQVNLPEDNLSRSIYGIEVDSHGYSPYADFGDTLVIDPNQSIRKGTKCFVVTTSGDSFAAKYVGAEETPKGISHVLHRLDTRKDVKRSEELISRLHKIISVVAGE